MTEDTIRVVMSDWTEELVAFHGIGHEVKFEVKEFRNGDRLYLVRVPGIEETGRRGQERGDD